MPSPTDVVFFFGGQSSEHEISCLTAAGVMRALDRNRFRPHGVGIAKDGTWYRYSAAEVAALSATGTKLPTVSAAGPAATLIRNGDQVELASLDASGLADRVPVQLAFPLLHGPFGEDGTIQGLFEMYGLPYVGAGVAASAIGMDKHLMKIAFAAAGLPVLPYRVFDAARWSADPGAVLDEIAVLRYPLYVKPARGGSSVGINRVTTLAELPGAITAALAIDPKVLVEEGVECAHEVECAVLGPRVPDLAPRTSVPGEIRVAHSDRFYSYAAKYLDPDAVQLVIPAELDEATTAAVRAAAATAFRAIGAEGMSRVDAFVLADGAVLVNEINTVPGFTQHSMFPSLWQASQLSYPDLISDLIDQALARPLGLR